MLGRAEFQRRRRYAKDVVSGRLWSGIKRQACLGNLVGVKDQFPARVTWDRAHCQTLETIWDLRLSNQTQTHLESSLYMRAYPLTLAIWHFLRNNIIYFSLHGSYVQNIDNVIKNYELCDEARKYDPLSRLKTSQPKIVNSQMTKMLELPARMLK